MSSDTEEMRQEILSIEEETEKTIQAKTFSECVGKETEHQAHSHPDQEHDQNVAIAHSKCRERFGVSKARVLFLIEKSKLLEGGSLEALQTTMEKGMGREDWIEYAALLKNDGQKHQQIADRVDKSPSWIKKYVNPTLSQVTPITTLTSFGDTSELPKAIVPIHTIIEFTVTDLKKETRRFSGWGSVELRDSQNEVVSIKGLEAIMPTYIKRGAPIQFGHSNRHVGKVLKYQIRDKLVKGKRVPGLWLEGIIFSDYKIDDQAWEAIQYAHKVGLPVLSLGATPIGHPQVECDDIACFKKYNEFQLYEFTITEQQKGSIGANPEATVEVAMAKALEGQKMDPEDKHWIGGKLFKMKQSGTLPSDDLELVDLMLATCSACQDDYNAMLKAGDTEAQAKAKLFKELVDAMSSIEQEAKDVDKGVIWSPEINRLNAEIKDTQAKIDRGETRLKNLKAKLAEAQRKRRAEEERPSTISRSQKKEDKMTTIKEDETPSDSSVDSQKDSELDLRAFATEVMKRIDRIEQAVFKQEEEEEEEPPEEEEEVEESKADDEPPADKDPKDSEPALTLTVEKQFEQWAQDKGLVKVASTPAPGITTGREITKGQGSEQRNFPTDEELREAMRNWKEGGPSKLSKKYGYE